MIHAPGDISRLFDTDNIFTVILWENSGFDCFIHSDVHVMIDMHN